MEGIHDTGAVGCVAHNDQCVHMYIILDDKYPFFMIENVGYRCFFKVGEDEQGLHTRSSSGVSLDLIIETQLEQKE